MVVLKKLNNFDILNKTTIIDIKPYISQIISPEGIKIGSLKNINRKMVS